MEIPKFGIGTYKLSSNDTYASIIESIKLGFRHFDTASLYRNEEAVGRAINLMISEGTVSRSDIFVTTKVWIKEMNEGPCSITESVRNSLKRLDIGYIDLVLLHGPYNIVDSWETLEELDRELVRKIGVSNFNISELSLLLENCKIVPYTNQIELSIFLPRCELVEFCKVRGIIVTAHTYLARGTVLEDSSVIELGKRYGNIVRVLVAYAKSKNYVVLFTSKSREHLLELYKEIDSDTKLSDSDILLLDKIHEDTSITYFKNYSKN